MANSTDPAPVLAAGDAGAPSLTYRHAIVIGASIAGLLSARVLAEHCDDVTIIERDVLPAIGEHRRAVPQGRHAHGLLPSGHGCLEQLLPGLTAELLADGALSFEALTHTRFTFGGHELARAATGRPSVVGSRPLLEGHVRRRVLALGNVRVLEACEVTGLLGERGRIAGVRLRERAAQPRDLRADVVVAATGRGGRVSAWLQALGHEAAREDCIAVDVKYASRHVRLPDGVLGSDRLVLVGAQPGRPRGMALFAQERGRWMLTLYGYGPEHHPPSDTGGFMAFAASVAPPDVVAAIAASPVLDEIVTHGFPANRRRRYERLRGMPEGLLVTGDALCSFNPIYGQGMSVAALEAIALRECLTAGDGRLTRRFQRAAARIVDDAWSLTTGADLGLPEVAGHRPLRVRVINAYVARVQAAAAHDPAVAVAFIKVTGMLERPPSLLRPRIAWRVLRRRVRAPRPSHAPRGAAVGATRA